MPEDVHSYVQDFLSKCTKPQNRRRILAFYGGSFTGIENDTLEKYLQTGRKLVEDGVIHAIKASTRPDMIDQGMLFRLKDAYFEELELGAQSMDDTVLKASCRGHYAEDTVKASSMVRASGIKLGIQIMPGLPGEDSQSFISTIDRVCSLKPDAARIYPAVVVKGTALEILYNRKNYRVLTLDEAVLRALYAYIKIKKTGADILRMGVPLQGLNISAGPAHPSFGFLVKAKGFEMILEQANIMDCCIKVNPRNVQELLGYERATIKRFRFNYSADESLPMERILVRKDKENACLGFQDIIVHII